MGREITNMQKRVFLKLVSADHHELDALEAEELIKIEWLR
jgi:hypothetical protein